MMRASSIFLLSAWVAALFQAQAPAPAPTPPPQAAAPAPAPAPAAQGRGRQGSPASIRPPQSASAQTFTPEQIRAGQALFSSQCGFCHGRDAMGGETGPDLTRSQVVAEDVRGDKIGPIVRSGRPEKGMPPFNSREPTSPPSSRYIHDAEEQGGVERGQPPDGRRRRPADRQRAGRRAVLQRRRRLREVPLADGRPRRPRDAAAGPPAAAAHALPERTRAAAAAPPYAPTVTVTPPTGAAGDRSPGLSRRVHDRADRRDRAGIAPGRRAR